MEDKKIATWITHLRIADNIISDINIPDIPYFLIGSIAPDAGKLNSDNYTYTPSSQISHFSDLNYGKWKSNDREYLRKYIETNSDYGKEYSFHIGYFIHLLVDVFWGFYIYYPTKEKYSNDFIDKMFVWKVKEDWYYQDFNFLNINNDWGIIKEFSEAFYDNDYLDFYPKLFIQEKHEYIKLFYTKNNFIEKSTPYLSKQNVDDFISIVSKEIAYIMKNIKVFDYVKYSIFEHLEIIKPQYKKNFCWIDDVKINLTTGSS